MKALLICFGILLAAGEAHCQHLTYSVLHVSGEIFCERLHKNLATGDKLHEKDVLTFKESKSSVSVLGPEGRKVIRKSNQKSNDLKSLLTDFISIETHVTSSRGQEDNSRLKKAIKAIQSELISDTILIVGSGKASFEKSDLPLNDTSVIRAYYRQRHEDIERKISDKSMVDLSIESLFVPHQTPVKVRLIYYPNKDNVFDYGPEVLASFVPLYADNEILTQEVSVFVSAFKNKPENEIIKELKNYFRDEYKPVLTENLMTWLSETNLLKR